MALFLNGTQIEYRKNGRNRFGFIINSMPVGNRYMYTVQRDNDDIRDRETVFFEQLVTVDGFVPNEHPLVIETNLRREPMVAGADPVLENNENEVQARRRQGRVLDDVRRFIMDEAGQLPQDAAAQIFNREPENAGLQMQIEIRRQQRMREQEITAEQLRTQQQRVDANLILAVDARNKTTGDYSSRLDNKNRFLRFQLTDGLLLRPIVKINDDGNFFLEHEDERERAWVNSFQDPGVNRIQNVRDQNGVQWALKENLNRLRRNPAPPDFNMKKPRKKLRKKYKEMPQIESEDHYANKKFIA